MDRRIPGPRPWVGMVGAGLARYHSAKPLPRGFSEPVTGPMGCVAETWTIEKRGHAARLATFGPERASGE